MDQAQPTVVFEPVPERSAERGLAEVSRGNMGLVAGAAPRFADETARLLHRRLLAATIAHFVVLAAAFLGNLLGENSTQWELRTSVLLLLLAGIALLRRNRWLSLGQLRTLELIIFGVVVGQLALMMVTRISAAAMAQDPASAAAAQHIFLGAWCVLILTYGIFLPNSWQRGALVMVPMALVPYLVLGIQRWLSPGVASLLDTARMTSPVPLPLVAALVSIYGTHIINSARREAFKARQFGQYRLLDRLGSGGMGNVFKAEHVLLKRPCAIKLIKPENESDLTTLTRFETEVKATAKLTHWNTIEIYDYGHTDDGTFYYVMELLSGMSFEELVKSHGPQPPGRVVYLMRQVCGALQEAHGAGLIHRDIKPANIFAARRGGVFDVVKLLDFGLVKETVEDGTGPDKRNGSAFCGTPLFMAPEQASAYDDVDGRADIYSLGTVAYFLLTGQPPFRGKTLSEILAAHARGEVPPPTHLNPAVPADLEQVVLKCLAKQPAERFPNAAGLMLALDACDCARQWSEDHAAHWWHSRNSQRTPNGHLKEEMV